MVELKDGGVPLAAVRTSGAGEVLEEAVVYSLLEERSTPVHIGAVLLEVGGVVPATDFPIAISAHVLVTCRGRALAVEVGQWPQLPTQRTLLHCVRSTR